MMEKGLTSSSFEMKAGKLDTDAIVDASSDCPEEVYENEGVASLRSDDDDYLAPSSGPEAHYDVITAHTEGGPPPPKQEEIMIIMDEEHHKQEDGIYEDVAPARDDRNSPSFSNPQYEKQGNGDATVQRKKSKKGKRNSGQQKDTATKDNRSTSFARNIDFAAIRKNRPYLAVLLAVSLARVFTGAALCALQLAVTVLHDTTGGLFLGYSVSLLDLTMGFLGVWLIWRLKTYTVALSQLMVLFVFGFFNAALAVLFMCAIGQMLIVHNIDSGLMNESLWVYAVGFSIIVTCVVDITAIALTFVLLCYYHQPHGNHSSC